MRVLILLALALSLSVAQAQTPEAINAYVEKYKAIAIEEMKKYGIPASVTLAQGIHESGCGTSTLALRSNNHFGIKCHEEWCGQTYHHDDDAPQECFRVYNCPEESFRDHSEFLKCRPRYANLFTLDKGDYKAWARGLKAAGYATNPRYPDIIIKLIEDYNLNQFDKPGGGAAVAKADTKTDTKVSNEVQMIKQSLIQSTAPVAVAKQPESKPVQPAVAVVAKPVETKPLAPVDNTFDPSKVKIEERIINGTRALVYKQGIPLTFIAQKYNLTVEQIYALNDMFPNSKFNDNDLVYVENKKPEATYYQYEVSDGETMRTISQKFAVQLSELIKRNGINPGCEPVSGEIVVLRGKREFPLKFRVTGKTYPVRSAAESNIPIDPHVHTVSTSETLYSISRQYNIPLDTLKRINGLKDEDIKIGQTLVVNL